MSKLQEKMNVFLADQIVFGMKVHNIHWFLHGDKFFEIHEKMDEYYADIETCIDEVAERLLAIGGKPVPSVAKALELTSITELDETMKTAKEGLELLVVDYENIRENTLELIELAGEAGDPGTEDYFTSLSLDLDKTLWMIHAYLK